MEKIENLFFYEKGLITEFNTPGHSNYFFFDQDDRVATVNMEFQHFHRFYEIHLLLDREASHLIEGKRFQLRPFDVVMLPPSLLHKSIYPDGPAVKRLIIDFKLPVLNDSTLSAECEKLLSPFYADVPIYRFERSIQEQLAGHINNVYKALKSDSEIKYLTAQSEFISFLECIFENRNANIYATTQENDLSAKIYSITSYIHSHYSDDITLESLSKQFFISTFYLSHRFKEITGFTLSTYIQMTRIRNAQQLLFKTNIKITEVASLCGFNSFSQFNRIFNKLCGISPSAFKQKTKDPAFNEIKFLPMISES